MKILDIICKLFHIAACSAVIMFCGIGITHMEYAADVADWWVKQHVSDAENNAIKSRWRAESGKQ